jgi:hypothetical protein
LDLMRAGAMNEVLRFRVGMTPAIPALFAAALRPLHRGGR